MCRASWRHSDDALEEIAETTVRNIADFEAGRELVNEICIEPGRRERRAA